MTKLRFVIMSVVFLTGCATKERAYHTGPRGGCYSVTDSGEKQYVDSSLCRQAAVAREPEMTESQKQELEVFRQMFVKEFDRVSKCRLLTLMANFARETIITKVMLFAMTDKSMSQLMSITRH